MKKTAVVLALLTAGCGGGPKAATEANWESEVLAPGRAVLVDFWAPWCGPCRTMSPTVRTLAQDYRVYKVNVDENPSIARHYEVGPIPALLIFKDGQVVARFEGVTAEQTLRKALDKHGGR